MASRSTPASASNFEQLEWPGAQLLAWAAIQRTPEAKRSAWLQWRDSVELDRLTYEEMRVLPVLNGQLDDWLASDSGAGVLNGILRRSWTENQVYLNELKNSVVLLEQAGCGPVLVCGSAAVALFNSSGDGPIRPIHELRLVVPRTQIAKAVQALRSAGWQLSGVLPEPDSLDWVALVHLSRPGVGLWLQWRVLPVHGELAAACETQFLERSQAFDCGGVGLRSIGLEQLVLSVLGDRFDFDQEPLPWELDFALLPVECVDWKEWARMASGFAPEAFERLEKMRRWGVPVPRVTKPVPPTPSYFERNYPRWRGQAGRVFRKGKRFAKRVLARLGIR